MRSLLVFDFFELWRCWSLQYRSDRNTFSWGFLWLCDWIRRRFSPDPWLESTLETMLNFCTSEDFGNLWQGHCVRCCKGWKLTQNGKYRRFPSHLKAVLFCITPFRPFTANLDCLKHFLDLLALFEIVPDWIDGKTLFTFYFTSPFNLTSFLERKTSNWTLQSWRYSKSKSSTI